MIFVDTSVWIDFFRGRTARVTAALRRLLDEDRARMAAPVRVELLSGLPKQRQRHLADLLSAVPTHRPTDHAWTLMEDWALQGGARGLHFGVGDLMVGAIASDHEARVWSLDEDFEVMASLGFVSLFSGAEES